MEERSGESIRIAVNGPESTGKSTLCPALAKHFNGVWLPEYARTYLARKTEPYTLDDVLHIAARHIELENREASQNRLLFIDTDLINIRVWLLHSYGHCPAWIDKAISELPSKIHLLCDYDLPWEPDPLRENPHIRKFLFDWYKRELETRNFAYFVVSGKGETRLANAISYLKNLL